MEKKADRSSNASPSEKTNPSEKPSTVTDELAAVLEEIVEEPVKEKKKGETVTLIDETNVLVGERHYHIVRNHREGFDAEKLGERYSEVLARYDYIVGDWGYEQLRLKGFFKEDNRKAYPDQRIDTLEDYLYEYCNFGCAYFVIERVGGKREKPQNRRRRKKPTGQNQAHIEEKKAPVSPKKKTKPVIKKREEEKNSTPKKEVKKTNGSKKPEGKKASFTIRQREE
ncbi:transcriptional regulator [Enterococcus sp. JM4C]|uniref:YutD family protein n=1 Tax=Candidatus Enterococcus huntleyi TaxID=1857217 RepID=UPI001F3E7981|nr:YutD family protein [Enterococcus sp. JM4C]KAF1298349.1 transcriptional regulator [Enterococcus sp. JM4C]